MKVTWSATGALKMPLNNDIEIVDQVRLNNLCFGPLF